MIIKPAYLLAALGIGIVMLGSRRSSAEPAKPTRPPPPPPKPVASSTPAAMTEKQAQVLVQKTGTQITKTAQDVARGLGRMFRV